MTFLARFFSRLFHRPQKPVDLAGSSEPARSLVSTPEARAKSGPPEPSPAGWWMGPEKYATRTGVRHLNPLNVKAQSASTWRGQIGRDGRGHAIFKDPADGTRAAVVLLRTYWTKYNLRTVAEILSRWAPTSDTVGSLPGAPANSPVDYARFVQDRSGIHPTERLNLFAGREVDDEEEMVALVRAMAEYEIGAGFQLSRAVIREGISRV